MIPLILALQFSLGIAPSKEVPGDAKALEAAHASAIVQPLIDYMNARFNQHQLTPSERGDQGAAIQFGADQGKQCGREATKARLLASLPRDGQPK